MLGKFLIFSALLAIVSGCSQRVFDGTLISTKAIGNKEISVGSNVSTYFYFTRFPPASWGQSRSWAAERRLMSLAR